MYLSHGGIVCGQYCTQLSASIANDATSFINKMVEYSVPDLKTEDSFVFLMESTPCALSSSNNSLYSTINRVTNSLYFYF